MGAHKSFNLAYKNVGLLKRLLGISIPIPILPNTLIHQVLQKDSLSKMGYEINNPRASNMLLASLHLQAQTNLGLCQ